MSSSPVGDLAVFLATRNRATQAQNDLARVTKVVSGGERDDIGRHLRGDFSRLASVERSLRLTETFVTGGNLAESYFSGMQSTLQRGQDEIVELGPRLIAASGTGQIAQLLTTAIGAEDAFSQFVQSLNTQNGGRSPFAGTSTNTIAILPASSIVSDLEALVAGAPDSATMITLVDNYFMDPAGGFETVAYQGTATAQTGFTIDDGEVATTDITALDPAIRRTLSGLAMATLLARNAGAVDDVSRSEIGDQAGQWMQAGYQGLTDLRAELGVTEARVETALTRHRATQTTLGAERAEIVNADPFEAAIELQAVETRLETLFLMTARLQRLTLAEYL